MQDELKPALFITQKMPKSGAGRSVRGAVSLRQSPDHCFPRASNVQTGDVPSQRRSRP